MFVYHNKLKSHMETKHASDLPAFLGSATPVRTPAAQVVSPFDDKKDDGSKKKRKRSTKAEGATTPKKRGKEAALDAAAGAAAADKDDKPVPEAPKTDSKEKHLHRSGLFEIAERKENNTKYRCLKCNMNVYHNKLKSHVEAKHQEDLETFKSGAPVKNPPTEEEKLAAAEKKKAAAAAADSKGGDEAKTPRHLHRSGLFEIAERKENNTKYCCIKCGTNVYHNKLKSHVETNHPADLAQFLAGSLHATSEKKDPVDAVEGTSVASSKKKRAATAETEAKKKAKSDSESGAKPADSDVPETPKQPRHLHRSGLFEIAERKENNTKYQCVKCQTFVYQNKLKSHIEAKHPADLQNFVDDFFSHRPRGQDGATRQPSAAHDASRSDAV